MSDNAYSVHTAQQKSEIEFYNLLHDDCACKLRKKTYAFIRVAPWGWWKKASSRDELCCHEKQNLPFSPSLGQPFSLHFSFSFCIFSIRAAGCRWPVMMRKLLLNRQNFSFGRLRMYSAPYKQSAPNNCLAINSVMSLPGPSHCLCIWLISNEAQGCNLEAKEKGGKIQKPDSVHGQWDHVTANVFGWSQMKHRSTSTRQWVAILRPKSKVEIFRNLTACMGAVLPSWP